MTTQPIDAAPCAQVPVHPRLGRLWANVRPAGAETPVPRYELDDLYDKAALDAAVAAERERCIAALRALKDDSGVNDDGSTWLRRLTRGDCVAALLALGPNAQAQAPDTAPQSGQ